MLSLEQIKEIATNNDHKLGHVFNSVDFGTVCFCNKCNSVMYYLSRNNKGQHCYYGLYGSRCS